MLRWTTTMIPVLALLAACSGQDGAAERAEKEGGGHAAASDAQRVYIDPETGEMGVPPADRAKSRSDNDGAGGAPAYQREERPDGTVVLRPKQPERHIIEAETDDDGEVTVKERDRHAQ